MKKPTVTIGIPAHNEEKNIGLLLDSILIQDTASFKLDKILILCDGCTDTTASIAQKYSQENKIIRVLGDNKRLGKSARLNQIYSQATSDIIVTLDADTVLAPKSVSRLVSAFTSAKIGLVGGRAIPFPSSTLVGKALVVYEHFWHEVVQDINGGHNVHTHVGPISSVSKSLAKKLHLPNAPGTDHWRYFRTLQLGFKYRYVPEASVYFKVPDNLHDFLLQHARFHTSAENISIDFGHLAQDHYHIPLRHKLNAYIVSFFKSPFFFTIALGLQLLLRLYLLIRSESHQKAAWTMISSSK